MIISCVHRINPHKSSGGHRNSMHTVMANGGTWSPVKITYANGQSVELSLKDVRKDGTIKKAAMKKIITLKEESVKNEIA